MPWKILTWWAGPERGHETGKRGEDRDDAMSGNLKGKSIFKEGVYKWNGDWSPTHSRTLIHCPSLR